MANEQQEDVPKPWHLLMLKSYKPVAAKIMQRLDIESFLKCRLVCQDWRAAVNTYRPKWRVINRASIVAASDWGWAHLVEVLIAKGRDVNVRGLNGATPLHWASEFGHVDVVKVRPLFLSTSFSGLMLVLS